MKNTEGKTPEAIVQEAGLTLARLGERGAKAAELYRQFEERMAQARGNEMIIQAARRGLDHTREKLMAIIRDYKDQQPATGEALVVQMPGRVPGKETGKVKKEAKEVQQPKKKETPPTKTARSLSSAKARPDRKSRSKAALDKATKKILPDLDACREAIRKERQRQRELNPPKPKPRKTRITRLKERLMSVARLIPDELADEPKVINATEDVLMDTLHQLCALWKINRIEVAERGLSDQFDKLLQKAQPNE